MMADCGTFTKLRQICDLAKNVDFLDQRTDSAIQRNNIPSERNILQCPRESLAAMQNMKSEVKTMSNDSLKIHSNLQRVAHRNQKLLSAGEKILEYLESETSKAEEYLKQMYGYIPAGGDSMMEISKCAESKRLLKSSENEDKVLPVIEQGISRDENPSVKENDSLALLKSPEAPVPGSRQFKKDSIASPEAPTLHSKFQNDEEFRLPAISAGNFHPVRFDKDGCKGNADRFDAEYFPQLPRSPNSPGIDQIQPNKFQDTVVASSQAQYNNHVPNIETASMKKFFETPVISGVNKGSYFKGSTANVPYAPYFAGLDQSPDSPATTMTNLDTLRNIKTVGNPTNEAVSPEVDFKLHSRRSVLNDAPVHCSSMDDDTVLLLRGGKVPMSTMRTPDSPDLTEYRHFPKVNINFDDELPATPPSPELTSHFKQDRNQQNIDIKENMDPSHNDGFSKYEVKQSQYNELPDYLKRVIPYELSCDLVEKVLQNTFALYGDKYPRVTTQQKIEEITSLGLKTKSFIFLLTALKIVKKISGTEYFEVLA
ncbi:uncharacterized protein LOC120340937 [Styela clava]